jgi:hypothetical protein
VTLALSRERERERERERPVLSSVCSMKDYDKFRVFLFFFETIHSVKICVYHQKHALFHYISFIRKNTSPQAGAYIILATNKFLLTQTLCKYPFTG